MEGRFHLKKIKFIEQVDEKDCGPACLAMISEYYGKKVSISKLRDYSSTTYNGTTIEGIINGAEKIGFDSEGFHLEDIDELHELNLPCIAHTINENGTLHYIVIYKINKNNIFIIDPAIGKMKLEFSDFKSQWTNIIIVFNKNEYFTKERLSPSIKKFLYGILRNNIKFLLLIIFFSIIINIVSIASAYYFKLLVDVIIPSKLFMNLHLISLGVLLIYIVNFLGNLSRMQLSLNLGLRINNFLMSEYFKHVINLPISFFEDRSEGEIISRFRDANYIREVFTTATITLLIDVLILLSGSVILFLINAKLFLVMLCIIPVFLILFYIFKEPFERYNKKQMEANSSLSSNFIDDIKGITLIKTNNLEDRSYYKNKGKLYNFINNIYKLSTFGNVQVSIKNFLSLFTMLIVLWLGSFLVMRDEITLGELLTFNAILTFYFTSINNLLDIQTIIQSAIVSTRRMLEILEVSVEKNTGRKRFKFNDKISLRNVGFEYIKNQEILKNINLTIAKNENILIVGDSGSGKSTLLKLLLRLYDNSKGKITIDEINLNEVDLKNLRENIGYVGQTNYIFSGTIADNITFQQNENIDFNKLYSACERAQILNEILESPFKFNTYLNDSGNNLSGGQIQRIALARVFYKEPEILLLDEPTSSLDSKNEKYVLNELEKIECTKLIIMHKLDRKCGFDKKIYMKNGNIVKITQG